MSFDPTQLPPGVEVETTGGDGPRRSEREYVEAVVEWAKAAYGWEAFWDDMNWKPTSQFDKNGKKLRDFIAEGEALMNTTRKD